MNKSLSIYSQNCYGLPIKNRIKRLEKILKKIEELNPDIICLQEIHLKRDIKLLNHLSYNIYYFPSFILNNGGTVIMTKEKANKISFTKFRNQGSFFNAQLSDRLSGKGYISVSFKNNITIVNTHLLCSYNRFPDKDINLSNQLKQLLSNLNNKTQTILCGDFNIDEESNLYKTIIQNGYKDLTTDLDSYSDIIEKRKIDYVFTKGLVTRNTDSKYITFENIDNDTLVTDHKGIFTKIHFS